MKRILLYDTTLRDGTQMEEISLSVADKLAIAEKLDEFGIHFIEGGYPGSNPKDKEFFERGKRLRLKNAKLCAFGMTRRVGKKPEEDGNMKALLSAETPVITVVGKTWDFHVTEAIRTTLDENLRAIRETVEYLKRRSGGQIFFDAEHFFDGYRRNPKYALKALAAAEEGGADVLVLCDTNGGSMPSDVGRIVREVRKSTGCALGIHTHNDSELAVANSLVAVENGATQVQGTINGYGERCGNANLCSIVPSLQLKMGCEVLPPGRLRKLHEVSCFVSEIANLGRWLHQPFVGDAAFAHKGGMHVSAVRRHPGTYEHIEPETVGNRRRVLISDLSGRSNILAKIQEKGLRFKSGDPDAEKILDQIKDLEHKGYQFEAAEASFELLVRKAMGEEPLFRMKWCNVHVDIASRKENPVEATIAVDVNGVVEHTAAVGNGPVNAIDNALRKALSRFYPGPIKDFALLDYKVRVLAGAGGTGATVRVLIRSGDKEAEWSTVGVSHNIIEASWQALADSYSYKIWRHRRGTPGGEA